MNEPAEGNGSPPPKPLRTGELLVSKGLLSAAQLETALAHQAQQSPRPRLGRVLVELGLVTSEQVVQCLAAHARCPYIAVEAGLVQAEALGSLPLAFQEEHNLLPLRRAEGWLTVALEQFNDPFMLSEIERRSGLQVQPVACAPELIRTARRELLSKVPSSARGPASGEETQDSMPEEPGAEDLQVIEEDQQDESSLEASAAESPVVRLVNRIIRRGLELTASDIHIEPDDAYFRIRYRVDGELIRGERPARRQLQAVVSRIKILAGMDISQRRLPQDGGITISLNDRSVDIRVSTMATRHGEKVVMRIVDRQAGIRALEDLGLEGKMLSSFRRLIQYPHGLLLVTGPTGSGKSTTLYSALSEIASEQYNTSTIEDPVERRLKGVNQFQVHEESGFTFGRALRSLLRQDPDVIMVGEIRDLETARLATEAALTGHLVFSTLHTNDAVSAVPRLVSMGAERFIVAATLRGVLAQRLARRLCQACRKPVAPTSSQARTLQALCAGRLQLKTIYIADGCTRCNNRGAVGRVGIFDLLVLSEEELGMAFAAGPVIRLEHLQRDTEAPGLLLDGLAKARRGLVGLDSLFELVCQRDEADEAGPSQGVPEGLTNGAV